MQLEKEEHGVVVGGPVRKEEQGNVGGVQLGRENRVLLVGCS